MLVSVHCTAGLLTGLQQLHCRQPGLVVKLVVHMLVLLLHCLHGVHGRDVAPLFARAGGSALDLDLLSGCDTGRDHVRSRVMRLWRCFGVGNGMNVCAAQAAANDGRYRPLLLCCGLVCVGLGGAYLLIAIVRIVCNDCGS